MSDTSTNLIVEPDPEFPYPGNQDGGTTPEPAPPKEGVESEPEQLEETPEDHSEQEQGEPEPVEVETVEITKNGQTFVIPKELEQDFLFQGDYTKKTQALADDRRALKAEQEAQAARVKVQQEHLGDVAQLHALETEITRLKAVAEGQVPVQSQEEYQQAVNALTLYRGQRDDIAKRVDQRVTDAQRQAQENMAARRAEANAYAAREIPNWNPQTENNVRSFAQQQGIPAEFVDQATMATPAAWKILHLASIGQQFLDSQRKATKPQKKPVKIKKVGSGGAAPSTGPTDQMSAEEWVAARNRQIAARRGNAR